MNKSRIACSGILIAALAACSTPRNAAPIVDRPMPSRPLDAARIRAGERPPENRPEGRGYYTVKKGDTLYRIALEFGQNFRDIVAWNNLSSPNDIRVDQVLRVLPPEQGGAGSGAQVSSVVPNSGIEVRPLGAATAPITTGAATVHKTGPRGDKRPYSAAGLAELQKGESATVAATEPARPVDSPSNGMPDANISWMWPAEGKVVGNFDGGKKGIDIAGKAGEPILAAGSGTVLYASSVRGYGNLVIVKHSSALLSAYAHNKTILVKEGQTVAKGQKIAEMGNSDSETVKLHFEIRQQGKPVDPSKFLPSR
ncbi:MAG: peptidase [Herminiimonas sp.]|nr:peptidase [Herminiimonas sp.]MDB5855172.1 peptidase [Herminiimonas sp.]